MTVTAVRKAPQRLALTVEAEFDAYVPQSVRVDHGWVRASA
jgi:hypothetical protein